VDVNILVAVPCYGGLVQSRTMCSLIELDRWLYGNEIDHEIQTIQNESLVTRVRNRFANQATFDTDSQGRRFTHLFFADADMVFAAQDVTKMLTADVAICGLPYVRKEVLWGKVAEAAKHGIPHELLKYFAGDPNINSSTPVPIGGVMPIDQLAGGLMLINTDVFKALAEAHPERKYQLYEAEIEQNPGRSFAYDFFRVGPGFSASIDPQTKYYLSEDYWFEEDARKLGFQSYLLPSAVTGHIGSFQYMMNAPVMAASGLASARNLRFCETEAKLEAQRQVYVTVEGWKRSRCPKTLLNEQGNLDMSNAAKIDKYIREQCGGEFTSENLDTALAALTRSLSWYLAPEALTEVANPN
jgi:hypothetical protein